MASQSNSSYRLRGLVDSHWKRCQCNLLHNCKQESGWLLYIQSLNRTFLDRDQRISDWRKRYWLGSPS